MREDIEPPSKLISEYLTRLTERVADGGDAHSVINVLQSYVNELQHRWSGGVIIPVGGSVAAAAEAATSVPSTLPSNMQALPALSTPMLVPFFGGTPGLTPFLNGENQFMLSFPGNMPGSPSVVLPNSSVFMPQSLTQSLSQNLPQNLPQSLPQLPAGTSDEPPAKRPRRTASRDGR